jgi:hypothetical protein
MPSALDTLRPVLSKLSNIAFVLVLASYILMNFTRLDISMLRTLQIVAWSTFAMVCVMEAMMPSRAKYAFLNKVLSMGTAVAAIGILFITMKWEGSKNLLLAGVFATLPISLLLLLLTRNADNTLLKGLVVGGLAAYLARGLFL